MWRKWEPLPSPSCWHPHALVQLFMDVLPSKWYLPTHLPSPANKCITSYALYTCCAVYKPSCLAGVTSPTIPQVEESLLPLIFLYLCWSLLILPASIGRLTGQIKRVSNFNLCRCCDAFLRHVLSLHLHPPPRMLCKFPGSLMTPKKAWGTVLLCCMTISGLGHWYQGRGGTWEPSFQPA